MNSKKKLIVSFTPLGGCGEIGGNFYLYKGSRETILVDCGILFPHEDVFEIQYLIPDLSTIDQPDCLIITHGHDDHIGAIKHVVERWPNIRIFAPNFATELIKDKMISSYFNYEIEKYFDNSIIKLNEFQIFPIAVNHSIPDSFGLIIEHNESLMQFFHLSDFKIDDQQSFEKHLDLEKIYEIQKRSQKKFLLIDNTNISSYNISSGQEYQSTNTNSETTLINSFDKIFELKNRIFITLFSSNVQRLKNIFECAKKHEKKIVLCGKSMNSTFSIAQKTGLIKDTNNILISAESAKHYSPERLIILLSGCQGDFKSAFRRIVSGTDPNFKLDASDIFILSSKSIPGNETKVQTLKNLIAESGARLISGDTQSNDCVVHVSGHPTLLDIKTVINTYCPTDIIPIHGNSEFFQIFKQMVESNKFVNTNNKSNGPTLYSNPTCHLIYNDNKIVIEYDTQSKEFAVEKNYCDKTPFILMYGSGQKIERTAISQRRKIAADGAVLLTIVVSNNKRKIEFTTLGLPDEFSHHHDNLHEVVKDTYQRFHKKSPEVIKEELRLAVRRFVQEKIELRPVTIVHLLT